MNKSGSSSEKCTLDFKKNSSRTILTLPLGEKAEVFYQKDQMNVEVFPVLSAASERESSLPAVSVRSHHFLYRRKQPTYLGLKRCSGENKTLMWNLKGNGNNKNT